MSSFDASRTLTRALFVAILALPAAASAQSAPELSGRFGATPVGVPPGSSGVVEVVLTNAGTETASMSALTLRVLGRMLTGDVSLRNVSGPIGIAQVAGDTAAFGLSAFLKFLAVVSISIGVLNLLPIPVLDGGQLLFLAIERLRGGPLSEAAEAFGQRIGLVLLVLLMGLAFYNDLSGPLG